MKKNQTVEKAAEFLVDLAVFVLIADAGALVSSASLCQLELHCKTNRKKEIGN